jgi:hypothetical protein
MIGVGDAVGGLESNIINTERYVKTGGKLVIGEAFLNIKEVQDSETWLYS